MTEKPQVTLEVVAKVDQVGAITSNMIDVQQQALAIKEWYQDLVITEEMIPDMKKEKALVNKMKDSVATYRKNIVAEFKKPIDEFEKTAKETEKILKEAYSSIDSQISFYETETKKKMEEELKEYFKEYAASKNIDFVDYEQMEISVGLSSSMKKMKKDISNRLDLISEHLKVFDTYNEELKVEALLEYKKTLNFTNSILTAQARIKAREEEKAKQEDLAALKAEEEKAVAKVEEVIEEVKAPVEVSQEAPEEPKKEAPKMYHATFTVYGTIDQLKNLKAFLEKEGMKYDSGK